MSDDHAEEGRTTQFVSYWLSQRPDLDSDSLALQLTLARIGLLSRRTLSKLAEAQGITATDFNILGAIKRGSHAGSVRPSDLRKLFSLTPSTISYRIDRLFELGLVERLDQAGDRRVILLRLTAEGEAKVDNVMTGYTSVLNQKLEAVDSRPGGRRELIRLLAALARTWEDAEESDPD